MADSQASNPDLKQEQSATPGIDGTEQENAISGASSTKVTSAAASQSTLTPYVQQGNRECLTVKQILHHNP